MKSKTSAIIVSWNNKKIIDECIESLNDQTSSLLEVYLVDNDSKDGTAQHVRDKYPNVKVLAQAKNTGFAKGNNIGIKQALENRKCKNVLFLNADARIEKDWVEKNERFIEEHPKTAAVQGLTLNYFDKKKVDSVGIKVDQAGRSLQIGFDTKRTKNYSATQILGVNAAAAMYTADFLKNQPFNDYFDETLFMYYEDVDLSLRANVMGYKIYFNPETIAYHMGSASKNKPKAERLMLRNSSLILIKNLPFTFLLKMFLPHVKSEILRILSHIKHGEYRLFWAALTGKFLCVFLVPVFIYKRFQLKPKTNINKAVLWSLM